MRRGTRVGGSRAGLSALAVAVGLLLSGCQANDEAGGRDTVSGDRPAVVDRGLPAAPIGLVVSPRDGATSVLPGEQVEVSAEHGEVADVVVVGSSAPALVGKVEGGRWRSEPGQRMPLGASYHVYALITDAAGQTQSVTTTFQVLDAKHELRASVAPLAGETVGIGMPVIVYFSAPVEDKAAVESLMRVRAEPAVEGAWHWFSPKEAHYRPREYWTPDTKVSVELALEGVDAGAGVRGTSSRMVSFSIGDAHVSHVDALKHEMTVTSNGKVVRTVKVSTGRDKYPTASGVHVVVEKTALKIMDSATVGIPRDAPDGYYEKVPFSTRISYSGEFVHSASWSVRDQGVRNVSHGCVNVSPADAKWFFDFSRRGDIVDVTGTKKPYAQGRGFQEWTFSWDEWKAGSALSS